MNNINSTIYKFKDISTIYDHEYYNYPFYESYVPYEYDKTGLELGYVEDAYFAWLRSYSYNYFKTHNLLDKIMDRLAIIKPYVTTVRWSDHFLFNDGIKEFVKFIKLIMVISAYGDLHNNVDVIVDLPNSVVNKPVEYDYPLIVIKTTKNSDKFMIHIFADFRIKTDVNSLPEDWKHHLNIRNPDGDPDHDYITVFDFGREFIFEISEIFEEKVLLDKFFFRYDFSPMILN